MFGNILGKNKDETTKDNSNKEIIEKVSKMNLTDMRTYVNNRIKDFEICENGLLEVMHRLVQEDENTSKRYIQEDDMDSKKKKAFDLVLTIGANKKITIVVIELIQEFVKVYADMIAKFDKDYKQIYSSRFKDCIEKAITIVEKTADYNRKMGVLADK